MHTPHTPSNFRDSEALSAFVAQQQAGQLMIGHFNCADYDGMVLALMIVFDARQATYELDLQWCSYGLDFYGDTLQETYLYAFDSLAQLLEYLSQAHSIQVTDIPLKYRFDPQGHPDPLKDADKKPLFELGWQRFQQDFKAGKFLDPSLKLVYTS